MKHKTVMALMNRYSIPVGTLHQEWHVAHCAQHRLRWTRNSTGHVAALGYFRTDRHVEMTAILALRKGGTVKRFIEVVKARHYVVAHCGLEFGPDATLHLKPSLRAYVVGSPYLRLWSKEALAMGEALIAGECPPEVVLDWLKDHGHLSP